MLPHDDKPLPGSCAEPELTELSTAKGAEEEENDRKFERRRRTSMHCGRTRGLRLSDQQLQQQSLLK